MEVGYWVILKGWRIMKEVVKNEYFLEKDNCDI